MMPILLFLSILNRIKGLVVYSLYINKNRSFLFAQAQKLFFFSILTRQLLLDHIILSFITYNINLWEFKGTFNISIYSYDGVFWVVKLVKLLYR